MIEVRIFCLSFSCIGLYKDVSKGFWGVSSLRHQHTFILKTSGQCIKYYLEWDVKVPIIEIIHRVSNQMNRSKSNRHRVFCTLFRCIERENEKETPLIIASSDYNNSAHVYSNLSQRASCRLWCGTGVKRPFMWRANSTNS